MKLLRKTYTSHSDEQLVALYKQKADKKIIGEIYVRYGHLVLGTCIKYLKNKQDAEDIAMLVFEKLPKIIVRHNIQYFKSWLYMVTKNECLMWLRKKGNVTAELKIELEQEDELEIVQQKEVQLEAIESAILELKDEQKKCIELFYLERKSYSEITDILKMELKKVKSAIQNGKRNLKIKLEQREEFKSFT